MISAAAEAVTKDITNMKNIMKSYLEDMTTMTLATTRIMIGVRIDKYLLNILQCGRLQNSVFYLSYSVSFRFVHKRKCWRLMLR